MNNLTVEMLKTKYASTPHPTIMIDGVPLDLYLHELYPDKLLLGLVPTNTDWIHSKVNLGIPYNYELIGTEVNWLNSVPEMIFDKNTYLESFKLIIKPVE